MNQEILSRFSPIIVNIKPSKVENLIRYFECNGRNPILIEKGDMLFDLKEAIEQSSRDRLIPLVVLEQYLGKNHYIGTDIFREALDSCNVENGIVIPDGSGCIEGQREILESIVDGGDWLVGFGKRPDEIREVCSLYLNKINEVSREYMQVH